jgi:hypothetical protein
LSYQFLVSFYKGGEKQEISDLFKKARLYIPSETIVTMEGEATSKAFL